MLGGSLLGFILGSLWNNSSDTKGMNGEMSLKEEGIHGILALNSYMVLYRPSDVKILQGVLSSCGSWVFHYLRDSTWADGISAEMAEYVTGQDGGTYQTYLSQPNPSP